MSDAVDIHTVLNLPPTFTKQATASNITRTSMSISATATDDGIGDQLTYIFYWGTSSSNLTRVTSNATGSFSKTGLTHSTTYYYRIDAYDGIETTTGTVGSTATSVNNIPSLGSISVSRVSNSTSKLTISVKGTDNDGDNLSYTFFRGTTSSNITTSRGTTSGSSGSTVSITDTGLSSNTTYYYKVKVTDGYGGETTSTSYGSQRTYCLGSYCSGGYYTYPTCTSCSGSGKKTCGTCNGTKTITCGGCAGKGKTQCSICSGTGLYRCSKCSGGTSICSKCGGTGNIVHRKLYT